MKNCTGYRTEDVCDFGCLSGYELTGSRSRTCEPAKTWTGNETECESKFANATIYRQGGKLHHNVVYEFSIYDIITS